MRRVGRYLIVVVLLTGTTDARQARDLSSTAGYGIVDLQELFQSSEVPDPGDLPGRWVMVRHVFTERGVTGRSGPDRILFNLDGIHYGGDVNQSLEWVLSLSYQGSDERTASLGLVAATSDIVSVEFNSEGELVLGKDYAGDSIWYYRCRLAAPDRLVCLLMGHEDDHGVEFLRH